MAALAVLKLGELCSRSDLRERAVATLEMLSGLLSRSPLAGGQSLIAVDFLLGPNYQNVVVPGNDSAETTRVLPAYAARFRPNEVFSLRTDDSASAELVPLLEGKTAVDGKATLYRCERGICQAPVVGLQKILDVFANETPVV
jgi:hypothetical protein